jgi:hypothetical protein
MLYESTLYIFTKDKSLDTWIPKLLDILKEITKKTNNKKSLEIFTSYFLPEIKIKVSLDSDEIKIKFLYYTNGVSRSLYIDLDKNDKLNSLYGFSCIKLWQEPIEANFPKSLLLIGEKLEPDYQIEISKESFYESIN